MRHLHAQLYVTNHRGTVEALGTDGVVALDGRMNLTNAAAVTRREAHRRPKPYTHFQLRAGRYDNPRPLAPIQPID